MKIKTLEVSGLEGAIKGMRNISFEITDTTIKGKHSKIKCILNGEVVYILKEGLLEYINRLIIKDNNISKLKNPIESNIKGYYVGECGSVIGLRGKIMKPAKNRNGYLCAIVNKKHKSIHRLILESYKPIDNMEYLDVNHINGDKSDNRLENLEWHTRSENILHSYKTGLQTSVSGKYKVLTENERIYISDMLKKGIKTNIIANELNVSQKTICKYKNYKEKTL